MNKNMFGALTGSAANTNRRDFDYSGKTAKPPVCPKVPVQPVQSLTPRQIRETANNGKNGL